MQHSAFASLVHSVSQFIYSVTADLGFIVTSPLYSHSEGWWAQGPIWLQTRRQPKDPTGHDILFFISTGWIARACVVQEKGFFCLKRFSSGDFNTVFQTKAFQSWLLTTQPAGDPVSLLCTLWTWGVAIKRSCACELLEGKSAEGRHSELILHSKASSIQGIIII